jgi:hypothetical protein
VDAVPVILPAAAAPRFRAARFVAWANAVGAGLVSPDLAAERITADDAPHRLPAHAARDRSGNGGGAVDRLHVAPSPAAAHLAEHLERDEDLESLAVFLARISGPQRPSVRLCLPVPGDPAGLPGAGALAPAAFEQGEAVLLQWPYDGGNGGNGGNGGSGGSGRIVVGLVPSVVGDLVLWDAFAVPAEDREVSLGLQGLPSLAEADAMLASTMREAVATMTTLDVAPEVETAGAAEQTGGRGTSVAALRAGLLDGPALAPGYSNRAHDVLARSRRLRAIAAVAAADDGASVTSAEAGARRAVLRELDRVGRHAEMAALNSPAEPVEGRDRPTGS